MQHKQGENRNRMFMFSPESSIGSDSFVRVVDAFVDVIGKATSDGKIKVP